MKAKYIHLFFFLLLMISCEKEIEFSRSETEPVVVLNGVLMTDTTFSIHLSKSRFFLDSSRDFPIIEDADVVLTSEGHTEQMKYIGNGNYTTDYFFKTGDRVEIKATVAGFPAISAIASIPQKPQIGEITTEKNYSESTLQLWNYGPIDVGVAVYQDVKFKLPIIDNGKDKNYYRLVVLKVEHYSQNIQQSYLSYFTDAVFDTDIADDFFGMEGQSNSYNIFSDVLFNGSTYNLTFNDYNLKEVTLLPEYKKYEEYEYRIPDRVVYHIEVQQLSYEYFMYLKTRNAYNNNEDNPFMEPIQIFSNIENGTGILGSIAATKRVVEVE